MTAPEDLLKISELARRTGVSVGTIRFYIREGLLPRPTMKTSRNMAYYDESFVARIKLVRRLQEERRLPLSMIRSIVSGSADDEADAVPSLVELEAKAITALAAEKEGEAIGERELLERTGIDRQDLDDLRALEIITAQGSARAPKYLRVDAAIVEAVARVRALGLSRELFPASDLSIYLHALRALVAEEVSLFAKRTRGRDLPLPPDRLVDAAVNLMGDLIRHLRKKLIVELMTGIAERPAKRARRR
ncbi:MAG: MerR family transcriptional regulator [Deltaproteobacteria bacterium]|nr:MerR family transcriptional regulator [Deltaproteobacteria bacterium]